MELSRVYEVIKKAEPGSSQWCMLEGQKIKGERWNKMFRLHIRKKLGVGYFFHCKDSQGVEEITLGGCSASILRS